jgi:cytochrome c
MEMSMRDLRTISVFAVIGALLPATSIAQPVDGQKAFQQRCAACHSVVSGQNKIGPHLAGLIGRKAGTAKDARYSKAMLASGIIWTAQTLDAYLLAPAKVVPGTQMMVGAPNVVDRTAIIAYLGSGK